MYILIRNTKEIWRENLLEVGNIKLQLWKYKINLKKFEAEDAFINYTITKQWRGYKSETTKVRYQKVVMGRQVLTKDR